MRILLIKPRSNTPLYPLPMGLLYIGTVLKDAGYEVRIIDAHARGLAEKKVLSLIREYQPHIVGLTNMTSETMYMRSLAEKIKRNHPEIIIILGGPHISSFKRYEFEQNPYIDFGIIGEGERTTVSLIDYIRNKEEPADLSGIIYRLKGDIIVREPTSYIDDLDLLPLPDFSLINLGDYFSYYGSTFNLVTATDRVYPIMYSRGCPFGCKFCHSIFGKRIRYFSSERIIEEIKYVRRRYNVKEIDFLDDTINANNKKFSELLEKLIPLKKELIFAIPSGVRGDLFSEETFMPLKELGLFRVNIAYESASQRVLDIAGKNMDLKKTIENTYILREMSRLVGGFFMFGFPNETREDIQKTISLMSELPLNTASVSFVTPFPDTEFFPTALTRYREDEVLDRLLKYDTFYSKPIALGEVSSEELIRLKNIAIRRFYLNPQRILMNIRDVPNYISLFRNAINVIRLSLFKNVPY